MKPRLIPVTICLLGAGVFLSGIHVSQAKEITKPLVKSKWEKGNSPITGEITVLGDHDLPEKSIAFRLTLSNPSDGIRYVGNPYYHLRMTFRDAAGRPVDLPVKAPPSLIKTAGPNETPAAPIRFLAAVVGGVRMKMCEKSYQMKPRTTVALEFECLPVVAEKLLGATDGKPSELSVEFHMALIDEEDTDESIIVRSEKIPVHIPKSME